jgi:hypothetical protein
VYVPLAVVYVEPLFPKEQVPASIPPPPREVGTTLTPIMAFPCVRTGLLARLFRGRCKSDTPVIK